jgi:hypothetical protein
VAVLANAQSSVIAAGRRWQVRVFRERSFAAGRNSVQKSIYSELPTQVRGKPANAVIQAIWVSKLFCFSWDQWRAEFIILD